jgi:hypothetical protein
MRRPLFPLILTLFLAFGGLNAQMLTPFVTASAGDYFTNVQANAALSFTVGEMAIIETYSAQGYYLTNGFQQPFTLLTGIANEPFSFEFVVWPNPASDRLNFRYDLQYAGKVRMRWTDMHGVEVLSAYTHNYGGGQVEDFFNTTAISQGMYFLHVSYEVPGKHIAHNSIYKINIIH